MMRYCVLASDYDWTLAYQGHINAATLAALQRWKASGRQIVLVTGRILNHLLEVFPHPQLDVCDLVVAENGGVLYCPTHRQHTVLGESLPEPFVQALQQQGVAPLAVGSSILATHHLYERTVREAIDSLGLSLEIILNKDKLMVLPHGVNKATGLQAALDRLHRSLDHTVGVGDAENDHDFLRLCGYTAAVANALPCVQEQVDYVTSGTCGSGVVELIDRLLATDQGE